MEYIQKEKTRMNCETKPNRSVGKATFRQHIISSPCAI